MPEPDTRVRLTTRPAPFGTAPTVVSYAAPFRGGTLSIAYVPDRDLITLENLAPYLRGITPATSEAAVTAIAEDVANDLVPRWYRVSFVVTTDAITQTVVVEDRQPGWDHPSLLSAIPAPGSA